MTTPGKTNPCTDTVPDTEAVNMASVLIVDLAVTVFSMMSNSTVTYKKNSVTHRSSGGTIRIDHNYLLIFFNSLNVVI